MMKRLFYLLIALLAYDSAFAQNVGIGTSTPLMKFHVSNFDSAVLLLENTQSLNTSISTSLYFKTGNGSFSYTGALKTIITGSDEDDFGGRLGLFTGISATPNGLLERLSITNYGSVGIGTTTPGAKLDVIGTLKVTDGTQGAGKILTSDAEGLASWQPPPPPPGTNDPSVSICCQRWMTKNLNVATYRNGDAIPKVTDNAEWAALTTGAYCYYNNDSTTYAATYGKLYNWYAVNDPRGLAPEGWYIPTEFEWTTLGACLGGYDVAGGLMKETGTAHWNAPNIGATNQSGFTGFPGGVRLNNGTFNLIGNLGAWWSTTESSENTAWNRSLSHNNDDLYGNDSDNKRFGFSVRCIRD